MSDRFLEEYRCVKIFSDTWTGGDPCVTCTHPYKPGITLVESTVEEMRVTINHLKERHVKDSAQQLKGLQDDVAYWSRALDRAHYRYSTPGSKTTRDDLRRMEVTLKRAKEQLARFDDPGAQTDEEEE